MRYVMVLRSARIGDMNFDCIGKSFNLFVRREGKSNYSADGRTLGWNRDFDLTLTPLSQSVRHHASFGGQRLRRVQTRP
jgi:hypothetical protein